MSAPSRSLGGGPLPPSAGNPTMPRCRARGACWSIRDAARLLLRGEHVLGGHGLELDPVALLVRGQDHADRTRLEIDDDFDIVEHGTPLSSGLSASRPTRSADNRFITTDMPNPDS